MICFWTDYESDQHLNLQDRRNGRTTKILILIRGSPGKQTALLLYLSLQTIGF